MGREEMLAGRQPFALAGSGADAVLCLHGFTGSPGIYRKLAPRLQAAGFAVEVPLLPGHGTQPQDMTGVTLADWQAAAEAAYQSLAARYQRVHLVGLSLGGALACTLAAAHPALTSLVLLAPAFAVNPFILERLGLTDEAAAAAPDAIVPLPTRQPDGGAMDECIFGYGGFPRCAMQQLKAAGRAARGCCGQITVPTALFYTAADKIVDPAACQAAAAGMPALRELTRLEQSEHNLLLGCDRAAVEQQVLHFLTRAE